MKRTGFAAAAASGGVGPDPVRVVLVSGTVEMAVERDPADAV